MEISQGNSLYIPSSQINKNVMFFFLSFLFCKIGEKGGRTGPAQGGGLAPVAGGRRWAKRVGG
jgi:hypothetical protein